MGARKEASAVESVHHLQGVGRQLPAVLPRHGSPPSPSERQAPSPPPSSRSPSPGTPRAPPPFSPGRQAAGKARVSFPAPPGWYPVVQAAVTRKQQSWRFFIKDGAGPTASSLSLSPLLRFSLSNSSSSAAFSCSEAGSGGLLERRSGQTAHSPSSPVQLDAAPAF
jgi:hypothetical protein